MHTLAWITCSRSREARRTLIPRTLVFCGCLAFAIALLVYARILNAYFVSDDFPNVRMTMAFQDAIHQFMASSTGLSHNKAYRPLVALSWCLDFSIAGAWPPLFHLQNLLWHALCAGSLSAVVVFLTKRPAAAVLSAVLFTIHPLNAEAVSWISSRGDMMAATFSLLCVLNFLAHSTTGRSGSLAWAAVFFGLAVLTKETGLAVPFYLVVISITYGGLFRHRSRLARVLKSSLPFVGILLVYFLVRKLALGSFLTVYSDLKLEYKLGWIAKAFSRVVIPHNRSSVGASEGRFILISSAGLVLVATCLALPARRARPTIWRCLAFSAACFLSSLIPVYQLFRSMDNLEGTRHWYLPLSWVCAGWCCLIAAAVSSRALVARRILIATVSLLGVLYAFVLQENLVPWRAAGKITGGLVEKLQESTEKEVTMWLPAVALSSFNGAFTFRNGLSDAIQRPFSEREYDLFGWPKGRDLREEPVLIGSPWEGTIVKRQNRPDALLETILVFKRRGDS